MLLLSGPVALAGPLPIDMGCNRAIAAAESAIGIPDHLLLAIGRVESGRPDQHGFVSSWPWTINAAGTGYFFDTKAAAIAAVEALEARGVRSIDVGCVQVNLAQHRDAFTTLDAAFDPRANALYGARFLRALFAERGGWLPAAAAYHSKTPELGAAYQRQVMAIWPGASRPVPSGTVSSYGIWPPPGLAYAAIPSPAFAYRAFAKPEPALPAAVTLARRKKARGSAP